MEDILKPNDERFALTLNTVDKDVWSLYKKSLSVFWTVEEADLTHDHKDWNKMSVDEQYFIKAVLAFFATSDGIVNENICINFYQEVQTPELRALYSVQNMMETIHAEMYSLLIDTYIKDDFEKRVLFSAVANYPCIKKKAEWTQEFMNKDIDFFERILAFIAVEGIFFSGSFCSIFWLKKRGLMPGLCFSNEVISRDEGLHTETGKLIFNKFCKNKPSEEKVHLLFGRAVDVELEFVCDALPVSLLGMNSDMMSQYIKFVTDGLLVSINYNKLYNVTNPFDWMEGISLPGKTNFFEKRVSEYAKSFQTFVFDLGEDF